MSIFLRDFCLSTASFDKTHAYTDPNACLKVRSGLKSEQITGLIIDTATEE